MRKFKIKNRKKRRYIKKQSSPSSFTSANFITPFITPGFFLTVLLEIALCGAILVTVKTPVLYKPVFPQIHFSAFSFSYKPILTTIGNTYDIIVSSLLSINYLQPVISFFNTIMHGISNVSQSSIYSGEKLFTGSVNSISTAIGIVIHSLITTFVLIINSLWQLTLYLVSIIVAVLKGIFWAVTTLFVNIFKAFSALTDGITIPFRTMANYIAKQKPVFNFIALSIKRSIVELNSGLSDLLQVLSASAKASQN